MQESYFRALQKALSVARLSTYNMEETLSSEHLIGKYIWNVKLSENFYFLLHSLEVSLRNAIYDAYNTNFPDDDFFLLAQMNRYQQRREFHSRECWKMLCGVHRKLSSRGVIVDDGKIISELHFGFWTKLLSSNHPRYVNMWRIIFQDVFPNFSIDGSVDSCKRDVSQKIDKARVFRNRIFHYEPIFNHEDLDGMHRDILEVIKWINSDLYAMVSLFDNYEDIKIDEESIVKVLQRLGGEEV